MIDNARLCEPASGVPKLEACIRACELNHSNSCGNWAALVQSKDAPQARRLYDRSCKGGSGVGCEGQARMAEAAGEPGLEALYLNARRYHRVHCAQGYARSCWRQSEMFRQGLGGDRDADTARLFRERACSLGWTAACGKRQ